jgi:hypothetical protein
MFTENTTKVKNSRYEISAMIFITCLLVVLVLGFIA